MNAIQKEGVYRRTQFPAGSAGAEDILIFWLTWNLAKSASLLFFLLLVVVTDLCDSSIILR